MYNLSLCILLFEICHNETNLEIMKHSYKCSHCGKFIGFREFEEDKIIINFIPDTEFTIEKIEYSHKKCLKMEKVNLEEIAQNIVPLGAIGNPNFKRGILEAMKEACKQTLELAAQNANMITIKVLWDDPKEGDEAYKGVSIIDKQSILNTINQVE